MVFTGNELKILLTLSDESGYSIRGLAENIYKDKKSKSDISPIAKRLIKKGILENLESKTAYHDFNLHIAKDIKIFNLIITELYSIIKYYNIESSKILGECKWLEKRNTCIDEIVCTFSAESEANDECIASSEEDLNKFLFSIYTGEIIKNYGLQLTLEKIPTMTKEDFVKFIDWAEDNKFVDTGHYLGYIMTPPGFEDIFLEYSDKFAKYREEIEEEMYKQHYLEQVKQWSEDANL